MVVGAEIQARADAEAAIELADAVRGSALLEALSTLASRQRGSAEESARAAAEVVRVLVAEGFVHEAESHAAVDALATAGLIEAALLQAAVAEAEDTLNERPGEPGDAEPDCPSGCAPRFCGGVHRLCTDFVPVRRAGGESRHRGPLVPTHEERSSRWMPTCCRGSSARSRRGPG